MEPFKGGERSSSSGVDDYFEIEFFSNIRVEKPLISSLTLKKMMTGRKFVSVPNITKTQRKGQLQGDWVTIAVIVGKSQVRKTSKGNSFISWRLSSLASCEDPQVHCFLFAEAFQKHWKTPVGSVVGLLNPVSSDKEGWMSLPSDELSLKVAVDQKVIQLGHSKDFALCRSKTKAGRGCLNFVNKQKSEFCFHHVQSKYKKQSAKRADLQSGYSGIVPKSFEKKVFKRTTMSVNYCGQTFTSGPGVAGSLNLEDLQRQYRSKESKQDKDFSDRLIIPSPESMKFVKHVKDIEKKAVGEKIIGKQRNVQYVSAKDFLKQHMVPGSMQFPKHRKVIEKKGIKEKITETEPKQKKVQTISPTDFLKPKTVPGSMQFVNHLKDKQKKVNKEKITETEPKQKKVQTISARDFLKEHVLPITKKSPVLDNVPIVPRLGRGLSDGLVSLDETSPSSHVHFMNRAKLKALMKLKENEEIAKPDFNADGGKRKLEKFQEFSEPKRLPPGKKARMLSDLDRKEMKSFKN